MTPLFQLLIPELINAFRRQGQPVNQAVIPQLVERAIEEVAKDPKVQNATNAENPLRSRVVAGSVGSIVLAATMLIGDINAGTLDLTNAETLAAIGVLATAGYALWGRLKSGLKPMWSRWFGE